MRRASCVAAALALLLLLGALPSPAGASPRVLSVLGWLNEQVKRSELAVLGQAQVDAYPDPHGGHLRVSLLVGQVYHGTRVPPRITVKVKPGWLAGRYVLPTAILRGQWVLLFCGYERGEWTAPPLGRIVETPHQGLTFFTDADVVLEDAAPGLSWAYVLDSLTQLVATRRQVINGYAPKLRLARSKEQRDRLQWAIEYEVKDHLGLPVP
jgi:hypothetical protein